LPPEGCVRSRPDARDGAPEKEHCMNEKLILFVDDEPDICDEISGYLTAKGYQVIVAHNGRDAIKLFQKEKPILVLTDYRMPEMNGMELLRAVKSMKKEIHVVLISGAADTKTIVEAIKDDAFDFLLKPVDLHHLLGIIETAIAKTTAKMVQDSVRRASVNFIHEVVDIGDEVTVLYLAEDLDEYSANKYELYIKKLVDERSVKKNVVLFLKNVKYINNMGLNFLIQLNDMLKQRGYALFLCELSQPVDFYLRSLGYLDYFAVDHTVDNIVDRLHSPK
jgi:anti-anti-sigma factor